MEKENNKKKLSFKSRSKPKLQGKELSAWKKEKLGVLIASLICTGILIILMLVVLIPINNKWMEENNRIRNTTINNLSHMNYSYHQIQTETLEYYFD